MLKSKDTLFRFPDTVKLYRAITHAKVATTKTHYADN